MNFNTGTIGPWYIISSYVIRDTVVSAHVTGDLLKAVSMKNLNLSHNPLDVV